MKKIVNIMFLSFIMLFYYFTKHSNILPFTISFSMYILFKSFFSTTSIKNIIEKEDNSKIFKYSILSVVIIGGIITFISYFIGKIINIDNLDIVNISMTLFLIFNILIKLTGEYLESIKYKKLGSNLVDIYNIIILSINIILSIFLFKVFKLDLYINIIILFLVGVLISIILIIFLYICILRKNKNKNKKFEKFKINNMKKLLVGNKNITLFNIIKASNIYISVIILYYILTNKYNYNYDTVSSVISSTYLFGIIIIYFIYRIIKNYINKDYENLIKVNFKDNFTIFINKILKLSLNICILLTIISGPLNNILFNNQNNILFNLIPYLFFYILYNYIVNIIINNSKNKNIILTIIIGIIIKIIFEVPLINTVYRMGYTLTFGSVLASVLGMFTSIIIGYILIRNKYKLNILDNFNNILNIIYESVIYCLILVILTLIVDVNTTSFLSSLLTIIFYIIITILFYIIRRLINKK